jgi:hypothetical protein
MTAVLIVRRDPIADAWLAAIRERRRLGIAIAAMISNGISATPK